MLESDPVVFLATLAQKLVDTLYGLLMFALFAVTDIVLLVQVRSIQSEFCSNKGVEALTALSSYGDFLIAILWDNASCYLRLRWNGIGLRTSRS